MNTVAASPSVLSLRADRSAALRLVGPRAPLEPGAVAEAIAALHSLDTILSLELHAGPSEVETRLSCDARQAGEVSRALLGTAPTWEIAPAPPLAAPVGSLRRIAFVTRPRTSRWSPMQAITATTSPSADPVGALLEAAQPLHVDERLMIRYLVRPARPQRRQQARPPTDKPTAATRNALPLRRALERRSHELLFEMLAVVALAGNDAQRLASRLRSLSAAYEKITDAGFGGLRLGPISDRATPETLPTAWRERPEILVLSASELGACWHPPSSQVQIPGVVHLRRPASVVAPHQLASPGILLGDHHQRGEQIPVRLPAADLRLGHAVLLGRTGTGKSTLKHQILRQLMALPDRPAVVLIDPHGDLSLDLAATIPPHRVRDTVLLELGDAEYPIGLPLLRRPEGVSEEEFIQSTFGLIRLIFRDRWSPTRMEDAVFALVATLSALPEATLLDVPLLFDDEAFRATVMPFVGDPIVRMFWAEYERLSDSARRELARPILYRLRAFIRSSAVRNLVARTGGLDLGELVERHAIVLVSLAGSSIQAEADLLGELVLTRLHLSLLARLSQPRQQREAVYLGIDEAQRLSHATLPTLLGESRKLGLALLLSTQHLTAWGEQLAESVIGNVGTLITFRCGPTDSRRLAHGLRPFTPEQLEDLDRFEAIVKLQIDGQTLPAIDIRTRPIEVPADLDALEQIRRQTKARYGLPRAEVEGRMLSRYQRATAPRIAAQHHPRLSARRQAGPILRGKINMGDSIASSQIQDQDDLLQPTHRTAAPSQVFDDRAIDDDDEFWQPIGEA